MKTLLSLILLFAGVASAQDSTKVLNVSLQSRVIEYLVPLVATPDNEERFTIFLKWRTSFRATKPTGNTLVVTDTISTVLLAGLYNKAMAGEETLGIAALMKAQIASKRAANSYLNAMCTAYEQYYSDMLSERRLQGRKLLLGK